MAATLILLNFPNKCYFSKILRHLLFNFSPSQDNITIVHIVDHHKAKTIGGVWLSTFTVPMNGPFELRLIFEGSNVAEKSCNFIGCARSMF